jgi:hypothetical protein
VDLSGSTGQAGSIYQDLSTVPGQSYRLRFALAANTYNNNQSPEKKIEVYWGTPQVAQLSFDGSNQTKDDMGWRYYEYTVTATSSVTRLRFDSLNAGNYGPALDDVSVTR